MLRNKKLGKSNNNLEIKLGLKPRLFGSRTHYFKYYSQLLLLLTELVYRFRLFARILFKFFINAIINTKFRISCSKLIFIISNILFSLKVVVMLGRVE